MLSKLDNRTVQSSAGFLVTVPERNKICYHEKGRKLSVEIEAGFDERGELDWAIYSETIKWAPPHDLEPIAAEDKSRILANISRSLDVLEMKHKVF